jgi:transcriptional regulator with XRE-family HTH domain
MPPRDNPTARQMRLGAELRKLRESAGKTAREAAGLLSVDQAKISHMEAGRIGVSEGRIRRLATFYSCDNEPLIESLCAITREHRGQFWWDEYRGVLAPDVLDVAELEHHAVYLRSMQSVTLPGILQVEEYTRALYHGHPLPLPREEVDLRVEYRMRRRTIFERPTPPPFEAIIHEAALRMRFGGPGVARKQLEFLIEASEWPSVTIRVIPFANERFIEATQPLLFAGGVVPELDTVRVDNILGGLFLNASSEVMKYRALFDIAAKVSLDPDGARRLIQQCVYDL